MFYNDRHRIIRIDATPGVDHGRLGLDPGVATVLQQSFSKMKVALLAELNAKPAKEDALAALLIESQPITAWPRSEPPTRQPGASPCLTYLPISISTGENQ